MKRHTDTWTLALCIALLPPLWAVAAPYLGVTTGAVALICAGEQQTAAVDAFNALFK